MGRRRRRGGRAGEDAREQQRVESEGSGSTRPREADTSSTSPREGGAHAESPYGPHAAAEKGSGGRAPVAKESGGHAGRRGRGERPSGARRGRPQGKSQGRPQASRPSRPNAHAGAHRPKRTDAPGPAIPRRTSSITTHHGCDHVFFIGFLGAGKTTVARNLGNMFHRRFIDVDRMVERELHASVTKIFHTHGEEAFRDAETQALRSLGERRSLLVSCGGGVIERPENERLMREMGTVVFLDGTLEDSLRQIRRPDKRPDLGDREHARALYAHRRPLYERACDYRVKISGKSFEEVAYEVGELLWERGLL